MQFATAKGVARHPDRAHADLGPPAPLKLPPAAADEFNRIVPYLPEPPFTRVGRGQNLRRADCIS